MAIKICAVIVTYNRLNCLKETLAALKRQSRRIDGILVFDNHSTDGTKDYLLSHSFGDLSEEGERNFSNLYFQSPQNLGGSGGFSQAVKLASDLGFDYLWIMDDDVAPENNCLEVLLEGMEANRTQVAIPARKGKNFTDKVCIDIDLKHFYKFFIWWRKTYVKDSQVRPIHFVRDMTFEGPLISVPLIQKIGLPDADYFIQFDDTDYAQRLLQYSKIVYVRDAVLQRQLPAKVIKKGEKKAPMNWRDYYIMRNNILFDKRYGKRWSVRSLSPLLMIIYSILLAIKDGNLRANLPIVIKAAVDGYCGNLGKRVEPDY